MTAKIYYQDAYARTINAKVLDHKEKNGEHWLLLEQTVFYPGGGGQLPDKGLISGKPLLEIREKDGKIWHKVDLSEEQAPVNSEVHLQLDWPYRYYQMQQHTGQHLLSALLHKHGYPTVSVHLGEAHTLIEVEGTLPENTLLRQLENEAQQYIAKALPVKIHYVAREDVDRFELRRPPKELSTLRIVEIDAFDFSACGGVHVANTAEIGLVKILGSERIRGHIRIKAVIGQRAFDYFDELHQVNLLLREKLNTDHLQFNSRISQMQEEISYLKKLAKFYDKYFVQYESVRLARETKDILIVHKLEYGEQNDAAEIAKKLSGDFGKVAFLQFDRRFYLSSPDPEILDTIKFLKENADSLEIKGGGPQGFCQGMMNKNNSDEIAETIRRFLRRKS